MDLEHHGKKRWQNHGEVPALYKIFDEILVNAADNLQRDPQDVPLRRSAGAVGAAVVGSS